jgi:2-methylcitrate dehydratase PrpD
MDSERDDLDREISDLGARWELVDTGITVKLYPSCAATHPALDAILRVCRRDGCAADELDRIEIDVDAITPTVLIHDRPSTGLEAKFSMPFCAAAAVVFGRVGIDTFEAERIADPGLVSLMRRIVMKVDSTLGVDAPPLTEARVHMHLRDGRTITETANGARGYPDHPASETELADKFLACATRAVSPASARHALALLQELDKIGDVRELTAVCRPEPL